LKRACPALLAAVAVALLAPAAPAAAASCPVAHLSAPTHHPKAGARWPITVTCRTRSGKGIRATATYQFVYNGQVVATRYPSPKADPNSACSKAGTCRHSPYPFTGRFRDGTFTWPRRAVGIALKLRVVIRVRGKGSMNLDYAVKVHR
jgi:opacity protein-like surface antigen